MESGYQTSKLEKLLHRTTAGLFALSAVCFMIYTTELHYAHAEGDEGLGSASSSLGASVTVGTACNFSGNVDNQHNATITNGVNSTDIGKTTLNVTCNDQGGYAVYAIGYTNDEYGNTSLKSSISDDYNIPTGTSTSGNTSNWSMKLATVPGTTTATIENGYNNYHTVPDDFTKVATLNTITDPGTSTTGSSISTTYQAYISPTQPAGTYTGKVKYTLVHPSTAPAPKIPPKTISDLIYMQEFGTISEEDLASVKASMSMEATYILKDQRDDQDYTIAKLKDGKVWMTKNLNLAGNSIITSELSDVPEGYTLPTANGFQSDNKLPNSSTSGFSNDNEAFVYNSTKTTDADCTSPGCYSYYSWTAATAGSGQGNTADAPYSICPKGWKLPNSGNSLVPDYQSTDLYQLGIAYGMAESYSSFYIYAGPGTIPNYILSGTYRNSNFNFGGTNGSFWSSTSRSSTEAFLLTLSSSYASSNQSYFRRDGQALRCLAR